ncbi:MAG TPA: citryl-CoA lyase [Chloroflexota bacterium]|nr:citryl-CoA lyase [Chloroflexota bacterium]
MTERPRSAISTSTSDRITVRGLDLTTDLMGKVGLGDMAFLELLGRLPNSGESVVFNAMLVSLVEHGLTPNTLAARLTYLGSPEALQASVAAGVLGLGTVFVGSIEGAARMLQEALAEEGAGDDLQRLAGVIVEEHLSSRRSIPGLGHPIHRPVDPRARRLFELASENGLAGSYVELIELIQAEAELRTRRTLPLNVTGAVGALASELQLPWTICRGVGIMARCIGIVAHLQEEMRDPIAAEVWRAGERES